MASDVYERIWGVVRRVPRGRVATYGQIAALARASGPRQVGYALHSLPAGATVPWHRIVNAAGMTSIRSAPGADSMQRALLAAEGVVFDARGKIALDRFRWEPRSRPTRKRAVRTSAASGSRERDRSRPGSAPPRRRAAR